MSATLVDAGHLRVGLVGASGAPLAPGLREIAQLQFHVAASLRDAIPLAERAVYGELDIEPVDPRAGGYLWTAMDGSLTIAAAGDEPERYLEDLLGELDQLEPLLADLADDVAVAWR